MSNDQKMIFFLLTKFPDWESVKQAKEQYEKESKIILSIRGSHKLKSNADVQFHCKAGKERPSQSNGYRQSSTYKVGCSVEVNENIFESLEVSIQNKPTRNFSIFFKVKLVFDGTRPVVTKSQLNHENHQTTQQVFDH